MKQIGTQLVNPLTVVYCVASMASQYENRGADFHLAEYNALRAEVLALLETLRSLERNVVVAIGISWGWLINKKNDTPKWSWFVPVLFVLLGTWRVRGILRFFGQFRAYITQIEDSYRTPGGPEGWQRFTKSQTKTPHQHSISDGTVAFWTTLLLTTLAAAIWEVFVAH